MTGSMSFWLSLVLTAAAVAVFLPTLVLFIECVAAAGRARGVDRPPELIRRPRLAVLMPAHNEAGVVGPTVQNVALQVEQGDRLIVIADNCTDSTAEEAQQAGAQVWARHNDSQRGKGFAISYALERLAEDPPEVVVLVDADCRLSPGSIDSISRMAAFADRPVQAQYLLATAQGHSTPLGSVSTLAFLVRNLVRPLGLKRLGFPCHLTGSGMAFPWAQLRDAPALRDNLVEDLVMGLEMAIAGHPPLFCPEAQVHSELPQGRSAAAGQRRRWEHGQLATLFAYVPKLFAAALRQRRLRLAALAADLAVPPLALLVALLLLVTGFSTLAWALLGTSLLPVILGAGGLVSVGTATVLAWLKFGREKVSGTALLVAPIYLLWKIPLYAAFFFKKRQQGWVRTERALPSTTEP